MSSFPSRLTMGYCRKLSPSNANGLSRNLSIPRFLHSSIWIFSKTHPSSLTQSESGLTLAFCGLRGLRVSPAKPTLISRSARRGEATPRRLPLSSVRGNQVDPMTAAPWSLDHTLEGQDPVMFKSNCSTRSVKNQGSCDLLVRPRPPARLLIREDTCP
jgi:hypothetical protein